jgi:hypothetical protein
MPRDIDIPGVDPNFHPNPHFRVEPLKPVIVGKVLVNSFLMLSLGCSPGKNGGRIDHLIVTADSVKSPSGQTCIDVEVDFAYHTSLRSGGGISAGRTICPPGTSAEEAHIGNIK